MSFNLKDEQDIGRRNIGGGPQEENARGARKRHPLFAGRNGPGVGVPAYMLTVLG